jgi:serine/threonine protein kinase
MATLFPDFSNFEEIGAGGFKTVFKALRDGAHEVVKVINIPRTDGSEDQERFRNEALGRIRREVKILNQCSTPYLVKPASLPLDGHDLNGDYYAIYSEEFLDGQDLSKLIRTKTPLPSENDAKVVLRCLLVAIKELWSKGYVHRDIKPHNVIRLANPDRRFVLIDLGIAFGLLETNLTIHGVPCTARYLAPEMTNPAFRDNLDFRSDLYTSALTVFEYATGQHPVARDGDDLMLTVSRAVNDPPKPLHSLRQDYSAEFCALIDQFLKKKPALRPGNLTRLISQLAPDA